MDYVQTLALEASCLVLQICHAKYISISLKTQTLFILMYMLKGTIEKICKNLQFARKM